MRVLYGTRALGPVLGALLTLLSAPAAAERPLPSLRDELGIEAWYEVNAHIDEAGRLRTEQDPERNPERAAELEAQADAQLRKAIARATAFRQTVAETSGLAYLEGLAWRLLGDDAKAEAAWRRSIALDPEGAVDAWHDLGELLISRQAWADADDAFGHVTRGVTSGPQAWRGPLRQAEVAGWQGDPKGLEDHLQEALRRGYRMQWLSGLPQWRAFYADPRLHDVVGRYARVYGGRDLLEGLETP